MLCGFRGLQRDTYYLVLPMRRGHWAVTGRHLRSPLVFPDPAMAFECACDLAVNGRVEMRDNRGALLKLMDIESEVLHGCD